MSRVELQDVTRQFDQGTAIENISFEVPNGEFWVLVGPSGCGKSTILRTIAGLEKATAGRIYIGDTLVNTIPARQRDVAMVFQNYALYPHMTVADNLAFGLRMRNTPESQISERVQEVARSLDISHLLDRKPKQLSGGQQQRVALGRAIARKPQAFLLDEPLSNLDPQLRDDTRAELKQLHTKLGITTIYVTHDQVEAMTLADKLVVLHRGKIQQVGSPQSVYALPANRMVATFLGNPPMNILPSTYREGKFLLPSGTLPCPPPIQKALSLKEGQSIDLGIRPEDITVAASDESSLQVEVTFVEALGRETLLRTKLLSSEMSLQFLAPGGWQSKIGDRVSVQINLEAIFLFDVSTGKRLYP